MDVQFSPLPFPSKSAIMEKTTSREVFTMERIGYFNGQIGDLDTMQIPLCESCLLG